MSPIFTVIPIQCNSEESRDIGPNPGPATYVNLGTLINLSEPHLTLIYKKMISNTNFLVSIIYCPSNAA